MDLLSDALLGFAELGSLENITILLAATVIGLVGGVIPGISGPMLIVVALPVTYVMEPTQAFILLTVLYVTSVYGGMVTGILFKAPGTAESALTVLDGYPMTQNGQAGKALGVGIFSSSIGALVATIALIVFTPALASAALAFSSAEFFAVAVLGLSVVAALSFGQVAKGIFGVGLGLVLGAVGNDPMTAELRLTFDVSSMAAGLELVPVLIGLFALPEVFRRSGEAVAAGGRVGQFDTIRVLTRENIKRVGPTAVRSSLVGTGIGVLPGAGATTAAMLGYSQAVKFAKDKELFGRGDPRGIAGVESANNSGAVGALVPLFALGIPGSATTAILIGAFIMHGFQPGPNLMNTQPQFVYAVFAAIAIANIIALLMSKPFVQVVSKVLDIPYFVLGTAIIAFSILGSYSLRNSVFDVGLMLAFGVLGYVLSIIKFPVATIVLGFVLGPIAESHLRRALIMAGGDWTVFVTRPIAATILLVAVLVLIFPVLVAFYKKVMSIVKSGGS